MQRRRKKKSNNFLIILIVGIIAFGFFFFKDNLFANTQIPENPTMPSFRAFWSDSKSPFRKEIILDQNAQQIVLEINHAEMVIDNKSLPSGFDLNVIGQSDTESSIIPFDIKNPDSVKTTIKFNNQKMFSKYFLYFGNKTASKSNLNTFTETIKTNSSLDLEEKTQVNVSLDKTWILKENNVSSVFAKVQTGLEIENTTIKVVINDNKSAEISKSLVNGQFELPTSKLNVGENSFYVYFIKDSKVYKSNTFSFYYTAPLYVAWTIDWEGTAPDQKYLNDMASISTEYNVPMTHFYNPRIYIYLRTTDQRRKEVTDWVVSRIKAGDDLSLHMHMQHDLVEEAGVKAKYNEPSWDSGVSGYDTPTTAYSYDEVKKIIDWGITTLEDKFKKFSNYDIPKIQGYRAGGWFANIDTLKAIQDNGLIYDSSGRVSFEIGKNKFTQAWDLLNTSQPYIPSKVDQNTSNSNNMNLLEIPNNGADSYWSSAQEMIANFNANYNHGEFLSTDKLVVFLSHPDWFNIDDPKLRELFREIKKYRNDLDQGPVKFITLRDYLKNSEHANTLLNSFGNK